jgi:hypothetical protein
VLCRHFKCTSSSLLIPRNWQNGGHHVWGHLYLFTKDWFSLLCVSSKQSNGRVCFDLVFKNRDDTYNRETLLNVEWCQRKCHRHSPAVTETLASEWNCLPGGTEETPEKPIQFKLLSKKFWTGNSGWMQIVCGLRILKNGTEDNTGDRISGCVVYSGSDTYKWLKKKR